MQHRLQRSKTFVAGVITHLIGPCKGSFILERRKKWRRYQMSSYRIRFNVYTRQRQRSEKNFVLDRCKWTLILDLRILTLPIFDRLVVKLSRFFLKIFKGYIYTERKETRKGNFVRSLSQPKINSTREFLKNPSKSDVRSVSGSTMCLRLGLHHTSLCKDVQHFDKFQDNLLS